MNAIRMRFPAQALEEIRKTDPETPVSLKMIRRLMKSGAIPSVPVGNGNRRLINYDALLSYYIWCCLAVLSWHISGRASGCKCQ